MSKIKSVHKRFIELERQQAEIYFEKKITPTDFLQALTQTNQFTWLRPFSKMITDLDILIGEADMTEDGRKYVTSEIVKTLALPSINERYQQHKRNDPEFMLLHQDFMKHFNQFDR